MPDAGDYHGYRAGTTGWGVRDALTEAEHAAIDHSDIPGAGGGGGAGAVLSETVTVSSAELLDLHNTPKTLVAAQGAGTVIVPLAVAGRTHPGATPYAGGTATLVIKQQGAGGTVFSGFDPILDDASGQAFSWLTNGMAFTTSTIQNKPLQLSADSALTDGDGTLEIVVAYLVLPA